jgi:rhodanese-related sulfurtransferase
MALSVRGSGWRQGIGRVGAILRMGLRPRAAVVAIPPRGDNLGNEVSWIESDGLVERLGQAAAPVIIDVRGADEFDGDLGHLADARNIALPELPGRIAELAPYRDRDLVLVCHTQMRSAQAARLLDGAGFRSVTVLRGGMVEWRRRGLPVAPRPGV